MTSSLILSVSALVMSADNLSLVAVCSRALQSSLLLSGKTCNLYSFFLSSRRYFWWVTLLAMDLCPSVRPCVCLSHAGIVSKQFPTGFSVLKMHCVYGEIRVSAKIRSLIGHRTSTVGECEKNKASPSAAYCWRRRTWQVRSTVDDDCRLSSVDRAWRPPQCIQREAASRGSVGVSWYFWEIYADNYL